MAPAWAKANPAAKLERAQRSYNEPGMGFAARAARLGGPNLDSERSERIQIRGRACGLAFIKRNPVTVKTVLKPPTGFNVLTQPHEKQELDSNI